MGESKHTPGPWTIEGAHPWKVKCPTTTPGFLGDVATVGYLPNARLIAAAPELLDAARLALDWLVSTGADGSPLPALRDAIAKAEGPDA